MGLVDRETPLSQQNRAESWGHRIWRRLSVRGILVVAIALFAIAVGIDALHHPASAADLGTVQIEMALGRVVAAPDQETAPVRQPGSTYLEFDPTTAERLSHSDLTSAIMTRSRLTHAHFFTGDLYRAGQ